MEFRSKHTFSSIENPLRYGQKILSVGSCFAANMGMQLEKHFFDAQTNPNGIIFNPISLVEGLSIALNPDLFEPEKHVFQHQNRYYSWLHHGSFQADSKAELLTKIETQNRLMQQYLSEGDFLLLTWGSAHAYTLASNQQIVANCHKLPSQHFQKRLLSVAEIVDHYQIFLTELLAINPKLQIIWSISPVKYLRDGLHQNNLSKSTLFLALDSLLKQFPNQYYFPAFELLQDELRDYRFYAADMAHPSEQAIQYIWDQFREHIFGEVALRLYEDIRPISLSMEHRILHPNSPEHLKFKSKQLANIKLLQEAFPQLNLGSALSHFS
jgi:hypothetical protein